MKTNIVHATWVMLLMAASQHATAQNAAPSLTLAEALARATAQHPSLAAADAVHARARSSEREARSARYPALIADASSIRFGEPMVVAPLHGFNPQSPPDFDRTLLQGSMTAAYTLYDGGARTARIDRANSIVDAAEEGSVAARQLLMAQVARTYASIGAAREVLAWHAQRLTAVEAERRRAAQLFAAGKVAQVAVLRADAAASAARADSADAAAQNTTAEGELARLTGADAAVIRAAHVARLEGDALTIPDVAEMITAARASNPELRRLRAQIDAAEHAVDDAQSARLPRIQLGGRISEYGSAKGFASPEWQAGAQLSWQLFNGGARGAATQRAAAEVSLARADVAVAELRISEAIERAVEAARTARARVAAFTTAATQQAEVVRIEKLALDAGSGVQTDYLNAEAELFRLRAAATQARALEIHAHIELARLAGQLTPEWLTANLERTP